MPPRAIYEASRPIELVLEGENLTPDTLKLYHNGVLYTPLESSDTYAYYLLGDNGTNKVMLNDNIFCKIDIKGLVVPEDLTTYRVASQQVANSTAATTGTNVRTVEANCINYPFVTTASHPNFAFFIGVKVKADFADFTIVNGTFNNHYQGEASSIFGLNASVTDPTKPSYIKYQGFIVAVFNYHA